MGIWFTEKQTDHYGITMKIKKSLHTEQTDFQKLDVSDDSDDKDKD